MICVRVKLNINANEQVLFSVNHEVVRKILSTGFNMIFLLKCRTLPFYCLTRERNVSNQTRFKVYISEELRQLQMHLTESH